MFNIFPWWFKRNKKFYSTLRSKTSQVSFAFLEINSVILCFSLGYDESFRHCSAILRLPGEILASISVVLFVLCCGLVTYIYKWVLSNWNLSLQMLINLPQYSIFYQKNKKTLPKKFCASNALKINELYGHVRLLWREGFHQLTARHCALFGNWSRHHRLMGKINHNPSELCTVHTIKH